MVRIMSCSPRDESRQTLEVTRDERDLVAPLGLLYTRGGRKAIVSKDVPIEFACCRFSVEWDEQHYAHPSLEVAVSATVNPMGSAIERVMDRLLKHQLERLGSEHRIDRIDAANR